MFNSKIKRANAELTKEVAHLKSIKEQLIQYNEELGEKLEAMMEVFPFELGQVVYDVQLRSATGRFTKTKASREKSIINEVVVDKKNYFKLVDRYAAKDVFKTIEQAEHYIKDVCVE